MDWMQLANMGFQNQGKPVTTNQMSPLMTPEERAKLEAEIKAKNGGTIVVDPTPSAVPFDPQQLSRLDGMVNMSSPEDRAMTSDMRELYKKLVPQVQQGIAAQEQNLNDIRNTPQGIDFTPMAALADKWSGGGNQLTAAAQSIKGMSDKEKLSLLMSGQNSIQDDQKALLSEIGTKLAAKDNMKMMEAQMKNQRMMAGQEFNLDNQYDKNVRVDMKNLFEAAPSMQTADRLLTPDAAGNVKVADLYKALSNSARQLGEKGVLTDQDTARIQLPTLELWTAKLSAMAGDPNATLPYSEVKSLHDAVKLGSQALKDITNQRFAQTTQAYLARGGKPSLAESYKTIYGEKPKAATVEPIAPPAKPKLNIQDLLKE